MLRVALNAYYRLALRAVRPVAAHGIPVWLLMAPGPKRDRARQTVERALFLLAERDPVRLARIRALLAGIVVQHGGAAGPAGLYNEQLRLCELNAAHFSDGRPGKAVLLALTIAHEAMHGLLARLGYSAGEPRNEAERVRIERACTKAELAVLQRLAPAADQRAPLERFLHDRLDTTAHTYSPTERRRRIEALWTELRAELSTLVGQRSGR